jgi:hypothetical protein
MTLSNLFCIIPEHNGYACHLKTLNNYTDPYCKRLSYKDLNIKDDGGNDLGYLTGTNADGWKKSDAQSRSAGK